MEAASNLLLSSVDQLRFLYSYMASRWFVAGREELMAQGFSAPRIGHWRRSGRLVKLLRGVYSYGRDVECREAVWRAGLVAAGRESVLVGLSACEIWGLVKPGNRLPRLVEVAVNGGQSRKLRGQSPALRQTLFKVVRRQLSPGDVRIKDGLNVVSPVLALMDFAVNAPEREVRFAFLEACRLRRFGREDVDDCFRRMVGRRGATKLRPLFTLWVPELAEIRSVFEGLFLLAWIERGLPTPKINKKLHGYEVDCYWPEYGVVLELDGAAFHGDPAHSAIDAAKQRALEAQGLVVLRITYKEFEENPAAAIERVLRALGLN